MFPIMTFYAGITIGFILSSLAMALLVRRFSKRYINYDEGYRHGLASGLSARDAINSDFVESDSKDSY